MDNRRSDDPGRRAEDDRWLKVQKDVMSLVTATRDGQRSLAKLEIEVGKLSDHVDDVDDHLRGVAGKESLDTRVTLLEKEFEMHGVLLRRISDQFGSLHTMMEEMKEDVAIFKITKAVSEKVDGTRNERIKEWLKFWGPIILATLALIVPLAKLTFDNWDKIAPFFHHDRQTVQSIEKEIVRERRGPRGRAVRRKEANLERAARGLKPLPEPAPKPELVAEPEKTDGRTDGDK